MTGTKRTFRERLLEHSSSLADVPALVSPSASIRYGALAGEAHALAHSLRSLGIGPEATVALTARGEVDHVLATLALLELGASQVALASRDPPALRERIARRIGATTVLADRQDDAVAGLRWVDLRTALAASRASPSGDDAWPAGATAPALHLTGSGTTGEPKIIAFAERDLALQAERQTDFRGQRVLRPAHVEYNNAKRMRLYTLWQGGTCVLADGTPESLHAQCARHRVTWLELSPMHCKDLLAACPTEGRLPSTTSLRVGGARVPVALRRAIMAEASADLHVSYGTTETSLIAIAGPAMHDERETVGPRVPGVDVEVVRGDCTPAPADEVGEIRIRASGMARAYLGDANATAQHFRDGWFMPGDLASLTRDGLVCLHGRRDDMMIMNSINIFSAEIERVLESHPAVAAAAALPIASEVHGQIPVAAVELRRGASCTAGELVRFAREALGVRAPRRIEVLATLPRNAQGKIVRRELAGAFRERR
ncbi:fatty-acyl-CoA synthase [Burkholderiales bacterium]|nr:fatty-acyl-CoA synthase [Burkholderiales bacterium]